MTILKKIEIEKVDMACTFFFSEYDLLKQKQNPKEQTSQEEKTCALKQQEMYLKLEYLKVFIFTNLLALLDQRGLPGARVYVKYTPTHKDPDTQEIIARSQRIEYIIPNNIFKHTLAKKYPDIESIIEKCKICLNMAMSINKKDFVNTLYFEKEVGQKNQIYSINQRKLTFLTNTANLEKVNISLCRHIEPSLAITFTGLDRLLGKKYIENLPSQIEKAVLDKQLQSTSPLKPSMSCKI